MTPYFQDDAVTIYHGDCREIVPTLGRFDLLLTDPPYGVGLDYGGYQDSPENLAALIRDVWPIFQSASDRILLTPGIANIQAWPKSTWTLCWMIQGTNCGSGPWGFATWQPILAYGKDPWLANGKGRQMDSFVKKCAAEKNGHPCPKPLAVWNWIVVRSSMDGETILDPFAGSGTTGRAAKDLGRKAVLIEREERYCEIAAKRMAQGVLDFGTANIAPETWMKIWSPGGHAMTDRDVGELWQAVMYASNTPMNKLIRKLVEERAEKYWQASPDSQLRTRLPAEGIIEALDDFGIDPKTWEAKP